MKHISWLSSPPFSTKALFTSSERSDHPESFESPSSQQLCFERRHAQHHPPSCLSSSRSPWCFLFPLKPLCSELPHNPATSSWYFIPLKAAQLAHASLLPRSKHCAVSTVPNSTDWCFITYQCCVSDTRPEKKPSSGYYAQTAHEGSDPTLSIQFSVIKLKELGTLLFLLVAFLFSLACTQRTPISFSLQISS